MREILPVAARWAGERRSFAIATVVGAAGSAPREIGASMVVSAGGEVFGTVSGGCVESAVYERCLEALGGAAPIVDRFAYSDADAFAVGLTCGGTIDVLVRAVPPGSAAAHDLRLLAAREAAAIPTGYELTTAGPQLGAGRVVEAGAPGVSTGVVALRVGEPARLIVVGAVEFAVALARLGAAMGMRVTVVDPRPVFATEERFPGAEVVVGWPDRYLAGERIDAGTAVCVLTHDPKIDVPALRAALATPAGYVGAMGSRRTHDDRMRRLADDGVPSPALMRVRSPIGLDLGGRSPEETALSILAEIVADRRGGTGARLSGLSGPLHAASSHGGSADGVGDVPAAVAPLECAWLSDAPARS